MADSSVPQYLKTFLSLPSEQLSLVSKAISSGGIAQFRDQKQIKEFAKGSGISASVLNTGVPAVISLVLASVEYDGDLEKGAVGIFETTLDAEELRKVTEFIKACGGKIEEFATAFDETVSPGTGFDEFQRLRFRAITVGEFTKEFHIDDELKDYEPVMKKLHARGVVKIMLETDSGTKKEVPFLIDSSSLANMIRFLQFGQKQLEAIEAQATKAK